MYYATYLVPWIQLFKPTIVGLALMCVGVLVMIYLSEC